MDAAIEEYAAHGWAGFSLNAVARRAGVAKSTIYLRWADKDVLLAQSINERTSGIEAVDTGRLRTDLEALTANLLRHYLDPIGWATLRIAVDVAGSTTVPSGLSELSTNPRNAASALIERAIARREVTADVPVSLMIEVLYGAVTMRALTIPSDARVLDDDQIAETTVPIVDFVLCAIRDHLRDQ